MQGPPSLQMYHRRLLGLYALSQMEREGSLHGYRLSEEISRRTEGRWRPGPGTVYPALARLVRQKLARSRPSGRRRVYLLTPAGRALLRKVRAQSEAFERARVDLAPLWGEVLGGYSAEELHLRMLRGALARVDRFLERPNGPAGTDPRFRSAVRAELQSALGRWERPPMLRVPLARRARGPHD